MSNLTVVDIIGSLYMELINHSENKFKFYRMTKLSNDTWLRQSGRIGTFGAKSMEHVDTWAKIVRQKLDKGYNFKKDSVPHYIEQALNEYGYTSQHHESAIPKAISMVQHNDIIKRVDMVLDAVQAVKVDDTYNTIEKEAVVNQIERIKKQVIDKVVFTVTDIELLNKLWSKYNHEV